MSWTHINTTERRCTIEKNCFLCGEKILKGEKYISRTGTDNGRILTFAMHKECEAVSSEWDDDDWESFSYGDMDRPERTPND